MGKNVGACLCVLEPRGKQEAPSGRTTGGAFVTLIRPSFRCCNDYRAADLLFPLRTRRTLWMLSKNPTCSKHQMTLCRFKSYRWPSTGSSWSGLAVLEGRFKNDRMGYAVDGW